MKSARLFVGVVGGYAATSGYFALIAVLLTRIGWLPGEATAIAILSRMFVYVAVIIWSAAAMHFWRSAFFLTVFSIVTIHLPQTLA